MDRFLVSKATVSKETESGASKKRRKYDHEYLNLGFSWTGSEDAPLPQCVVCKEVLANDGMRPCRLRRHIETKHPSLVTKPREFFDRKLNELRSQKKVIQTFSNVNDKATEASYHVALRIAKAGKPHNIGETLILPAAKDMCCVMLGEAAAAKPSRYLTTPSSAASHTWRLM